MESKRILITGANGTVGKIIHTFLKDTHHVTPLNGSKDLNLLDRESVDKFFKEQSKFDVIIHCAAKGCDDTESNDSNIAWANLTMYEHIKSNYRHFNRFINIASGCELRPEDSRKESSLREYLPRTAYGLSKNLIARDVMKHVDWYNLRLFGIATYTRVFKKVFEAFQQGQKTFDLTDRHMDYLYEYQLEYFLKLYIETELNLIKDVNMVPLEKFKVSDYVNGYISRLNLDMKLNIVDFNIESYTGDSTNARRLNLI